MEAQALADHRKSAAVAQEGFRLDAKARRLASLRESRAALRSAGLLQDGPGSEDVAGGNPEHVPVFYLDGPAHAQRRAAIARFFTPKAIQTRYRTIMEETTARLLDDLRATGSARLDRIAFELTVAVAANIVGLTETSPSQMAPRLQCLLRTAFSPATGLGKLRDRIIRSVYGVWFYHADVRPAVARRRAEPGDDIISQCLAKGYSDKAILIECMTYATAGMVTTREFIVMVAWHLFDNPELRAQFLDGDEEAQMAILLEILRLEPIASVLYRRAGEGLCDQALGEVPGGERLAIDLRAVHGDAQSVGACPHAIDAERARREGQKAEFLSFGDGPHHCPGWQVALHETRTFIDQLLRVPGIAMARAPDIIWNAQLMSYELRDARLTCSRA
ncbi:cytochrome P450 [Novosphingobium profundi]|uniref:cytochrome P450 n=1 Tax=Novosphingobium profundi TaxID=1774954 RepID=UPI001CFEDB19|nr:cytochrome P450 [Novosphingobium profundi]